MEWWIAHVPPKKAAGRIKEIYERFTTDEGVDHVIQAHSPLPDALDALITFYSRVMHGRNDLPPLEREMIAVTVSVLNRCHY